MIYLVSYKYFLLLGIWFLLLCIVYATRKGDMTILVIYLCIVSLFSGYWIFNSSVSVYWDELNHLGNSIYLINHGDIHFNNQEYFYLEFPIFFILEAIILMIFGISFIESTHLLSFFLVLLSYLITFIIYLFLFKKNYNYAFIASMLFIFTNLALMNHTHASPFGLATLFFYYYIFLYLPTSDSSRRINNSFLLLIFIFLIPLTNPTLGIILIPIFSIMSLKNKTNLLLPIITLSWIFFVAINFEKEIIYLLEDYLTIFLQETEHTFEITFQGEKLELPYWLNIARFFWFIFIHIIALIYIISTYKYNLFKFDNLSNKEVLLLASFIIPILLALIAMLIIPQGEMTTRILILTSIPAVYYFIKMIDRIKNFKLNIISHINYNFHKNILYFLFIYFILFFLIAQPTIYYRQIHEWDSNAIELVSSKNLTISAYGPDIVIKKIYDEEYGKTIWLKNFDEIKKYSSGELLYISEKVNSITSPPDFSWNNVRQFDPIYFNKLFDNGHVYWLEIR